jgi:uncharacterized membrane protein YeaQ/YmgE (transglycosylase-associated protein family)
MHVPAILFGFVLATMYGALAHVLFGGNLGRLVFFILSSWVGFWGGHFAAERLGWDLFGFRPVVYDFATLGSVIFLVLAALLSGGSNQEKGQG